MAVKMAFGAGRNEMRVGFWVVQLHHSKQFDGMQLLVLMFKNTGKWNIVRGNEIMCLAGGFAFVE